MWLVALFLGCPGGEGKDSAAEDDSGAPPDYDLYACGWEKRDPGGLVSTGRDYGDVLADLEVTDQCGESFRVWDMFGDCFLLYWTAAW